MINMKLVNPLCSLTTFYRSVKSRGLLEVLISDLNNENAKRILRISDKEIKELIMQLNFTMKDKGKIESKMLNRCCI